MPNEIQVPNPPAVEIVDQNGKHLDTSAIDNYDAFMTYLMTASIASNTVKIRRYHEDRTSKGKVQNFALSITPVVQELRCNHPSQSIYIINDGPGDIFFVENDPSVDPAQLHATDELWNDFETHRLLCFYVWSAAGTIATARAKVKY